jgi:pentatricopeptide repeat protein
MLYAVGWARWWDLVTGLWRQMRSCGVAPDNATYGTLIGVYC